MYSLKNANRPLLSAQIFLGLIAIIVLSKVIWTLAQLDDPIVRQGVNSWFGIILITGLGAVALKLAPKAGFCELWDPTVSNRQRLIIPIMVGAAFGIMQIGLVSLMLGLEIPMVGFPLSIPVYLSGGILMEILYHLIPMALLMWFITGVLLKGKWQEQVFWIMAILLSLLEPVAQTMGMYQMGILSNALLATILFGYIFAANLTPLYFFRKYGFLAPVVWRLANYLIWHIIWPTIS
ncbi:MAG: hypothetical protein JXM69_21420 [Anaerolineae bacterium]|nr:hypothetical protein [Anaerolineae bacterium]